MNRKGIILAGGTGSRLYPLTYAVCKQLLPVYDKPLIYYPLATLMRAGIRETAIITTPSDQQVFRSLLGDGSRFGLTFTYIVQENPEGIAQALILAEDFLGGDPSALILGDNIFVAQGMTRLLAAASSREDGATILGYKVHDPERYGVAVFDESGEVIELIEKPRKWRSDVAVTGLYFYDGDAPRFAAGLKPSDRGELEITDLNKEYLKRGKLSIEVMSRGSAWLDTGTHESLIDAAEFVRVIEKRQGLKVACPEEIAWQMGYIDDNALRELGSELANNGYGQYLLSLLREHGV